MLFNHDQTFLSLGEKMSQIIPYLGRTIKHQLKMDATALNQYERSNYQ